MQKDLAKQRDPKRTISKAKKILYIWLFNNSIPAVEDTSKHTTVVFDIKRHTCCLKYLLSSSSTRTRFKKYLTENFLLTSLKVGVSSYPARKSRMGMDSPEKENMCHQMLHFNNTGFK